MDEKERKWVLISALPHAAGAVIWQRPSLVWTPFPPLQKCRGRWSSSWRSLPALRHLFWGLVHERWILKGGRKGQREAGRWERGVEPPPVLLWDPSQEVASIWGSVSFSLKSEGVTYLSHSFCSQRFYVYQCLDSRIFWTWVWINFNRKISLSWEDVVDSSGQASVPHSLNSGRSTSADLLFKQGGLDTQPFTPHIPLT